MTNQEIGGVLYKAAAEREAQRRLNNEGSYDYGLADELRKELLEKLGVESSCLTDLEYRKINDDRCIPILIKYIPLFQNVGISLALISQQFFRKGNKECSDFLERWYYDLKRNSTVTGMVENILDNAFVRIGDKSKIPFYIELINEDNRFPFVMTMLGRWKLDGAKEIIIRRLNNDKIKTSAIRALGYYKDKSTIPLIEQYLNSEYSGVRQEAKKVIDRLNNLP